MKRNLFAAATFGLLASLVFIGPHSWGEPEKENCSVSQTFAVENMTCAACPITVKKAMSRVDGVQSVEVNFDAKTVTVMFDPTLADAAAIAQASASVGFPAHGVSTQ